MFKKIRLTLTAIFFTGIAFAQSGAIKVHMFNKVDKQPIPFANLVVEQKGTQVASGVTDINGECVIKPIEPGEYSVKAVYEGFNDYEKTGVTVSPDKYVYIEMDMTPNVTQIKQVDIVVQKYDLINKNNTIGQTIGKEDYQHMAVKDINSVAAQSAGVYQQDVGGALNIRGARSDATEYIIDGVKITADQAAGGLPQGMIDQVTTIVGGIPAKYGDATGGIVEINTLGASPKFFGNVQGITSELLDNYGHNDFNFTIGGPIWSKKDTTSHSKRPIIDFILGGEYIYNKDGSPTFVGGYTANSDTLSKIERTPFVINPQGGFNQGAEYITADQINHSNSRPNIPAESVSLNGKLGFHITSNVTLTAGGALQYDNSRDFVYSNELFNSTANPLRIQTSWRAYAKLKQSFPTSDKNSIIKNAYYELQAEYGNTYTTIENNDYKDNLFDYGYIGKFYQYYGKVYVLKDGRMGLAHYEVAPTDSLYTYTQSTKYNTIEGNYTSELYQLLGAQNVFAPNVIQQSGGALNGYAPANANVYSLWTLPGIPDGTYTKENSNHFRFSANFSADIKNHSIQVGFEYEQTILSFYSIAASNLWGIMRQNVNRQLQQLDTTNPILAASGQYNYYNYNFLYSPTQQSQFDKSMRQKLGLAVNSNDYLQPDNYDPSFFNLNMFSASDLLNNGNSQVGYFGYDYLGNKLSNSTSIDDFFNKKDANGNLYYPMAPYHPIYIAGYIQDHFDYKSMKFDVGVRVDEFDANQPVLKDPYLLFPAKTVAEIPASGPLGNVPSNMGSNYVVYVNNAQSPTQIVGYRNGNNWYDANGTLVTDPTVLASATTTGSIQPYLENPNQTALSSNAFTTYKPQVNVMPRIAFAFPISDVANFYAHYDILTQRPPGIGYNIFQATNYLYIQNNISSAISNPNLFPQETTEYELGYQQVLNEAKTAALTLSAFYRENRNEIQAFRYQEAYPISYLTYSNIDFGTTKGLSIAYDLRTTGNLQMRARYTLQFANGTGSGPNSGFNLANSGQPNLQIPLALDNDQRHTFLVNIDYHYKSGDRYNGPVWTTKGGKVVQILANAGIDLTGTAGSGTPYTAQSNATPNFLGAVQHVNLVGTVNGEYLPWTYRLDLRAEKDFPLIISPSKGDKAIHSDILVYIQVLNLLNTQNIFGVYHYTGSPKDDGYLASQDGQQFISTTTSPQAFQDQYRINELNPGFFSLPRQIRLGVEFNF